MSDFLNGIANFTKSVQNTLNSYELRKFGDKIQGYVMNFTEAEAKVREATNEDPWGPTGPQMQEISSMTFQYDVFSEIMSMLWKRMFHENKLAWRRVYKSLILLNYLLKNGSERVISAARDHIYEIRVLESYKCVDERGKDEGLNVRIRVKAVVELLQDDELLRAERTKSKSENKDKYQSISKDDMFYKNKSSTFDNWDSKLYSKNESKLNNCNFDKKDLQKEITAFDFADSRNNSNSPELGIPDKNQEVLTDDDEFGEFSQAKTDSNLQNNSINNNIQSTTTLNTSATLRILPLASSPPFNLNKTNEKTEPLQSETNNNNKINNNNNNNIGDLFLLNDENLTTNQNDSHNNNNNNNDNLFNLSNFQNQYNNNNNIDNIFGLTITNEPTTTVNSTTTNNNDLFFNNNLNLFDNSITSNQTNNNIFNDLSLTNSDSLINNNIDFISTNNSNNKLNSSNSNQFISSNKIDSTTIKLPDTWNDLKGKVNIDFENLSLRPQPPKQTPTLNQLQGKNDLLW